MFTTATSLLHVIFSHPELFFSLLPLLPKGYPSFSFPFTSYHAQSQIPTFLNHHIPRLSTTPTRRCLIRVRRYPNRRPKTMRRYIPPTLLPTNLLTYEPIRPMHPAAYLYRHPQPPIKKRNHVHHTSRSTSPLPKKPPPHPSTLPTKANQPITQQNYRFQDPCT